MTNKQTAKDKIESHVKKFEEQHHHIDTQFTTKL